ncbi:MAG: cation:proton antiporter [Syntrophaceae bacterium]|nr:cation:proton antiporter [Syntrophaceae bacterium]
MTYYILIGFCLMVLLAYFFDITSKHTKIPSVLMLIITGLALHYISEYFDLHIPYMSRILPVMGTLGLILIVLEASLDLMLIKEKSALIIRSLSSAILLFLIFTGLLTYVAVYYFDYDIKMFLINIIPISVISSAVAIPSAVGLLQNDRDFVTYESAMSDIIGILAFDFILLASGSFSSGVFRFIAELVLTLITSIIVSAMLAYMLHKINHHVKYVFIMTVIVLVYSLAKLIHLPSLLVVLIFGLVMNNNQIFKNKHSEKIISFDTFNDDLSGFKNIAAELTFIVRSFFFLMFGFFIRLSDLFSINNLKITVILIAIIFLLRALYFKMILQIPLSPLFFFAPRGLITILLFLSIPSAMSLSFMNIGIVTQVIFITILMMTFGNMIFQQVEELIQPESKEEINNSTD